MPLSLEYLQQAHAAAVARKNQLVADLNAALGEITVLERLITEAAKPPEDPEQI